jgi:hypothetical protein
MTSLFTNAIAKTIEGAMSLDKDHREVFVHVRKEVKIVAERLGQSQLTECTDSTTGDFTFHPNPVIKMACADMVTAPVDAVLQYFVSNPSLLTPQ